MPSHSFSSITPLTYIAARVADLDSLAQLIIIIILYSLLHHLRQTSHDVDHLDFNKIKKPLIGLAEVRLKELNADKEGWEAPAIIVAREETAQQTGTATLSMQVNPQALLSSGARPFYDYFAICSPSQISLIINQGSFLHISQGPGVTVRVFSNDDEAGGLEGSVGM